MTSFEKIKVLLIEDNEDDIYFIRKALPPDRFDVKIITSGLEGYQYLLNSPDKSEVVLLDNHLPSMNGLDILEALDERKNNFAFVFLTIDNSIEIVVKAMNLGALDFVVKSINIKNELAEKVEKVYQIYRARIEKQAIEANLNSVLEAGNDLIFAINQEYKLTMFNRLFKEGIKKYINVAIEEGTDLIEVTPPEYRDYWKQKFDTTLAGQKIVFEDEIIVNRLPQYMEFNLNPIRANDTITGVAANCRIINERKQAEKEINAYAAELENIFNGSHDAMFLIDAYDNHTYVFRRTNKTHELLTGFSMNQIRNKTPRELLGETIGQQVEMNYKRCIEQKQSINYIEVIDLPEGKRVWETTLTPVFTEDSNPYIIGSSRDVSESKMIKEEREAIIKLLSLINRKNNLKELMKEVVHLMKDWSGCGSVGIRLNIDNDFPYIVYDGFSNEFIESENLLCTKTSNGDLIMDDDENPMLECMCGNVIKGRFDPTKPFFTPNGSFWTNSTTELLACAKPGDFQGTMRNYCNIMGYESLALVPIKKGDKTFGLLQFNDYSKSIFDIEKIYLFERIAANLAMALGEKEALMALQESEQRFKLSMEATNDGLWDWNSIINNYYYSPAFFKMIGYDPDQIPADFDHLSLIHPEHVNLVKSAWEKCINGSLNSLDIEFQMKTADGNWKWILSRGKVVEKDKDGKTSRIIGTHLDMTEIKKAKDMENKMILAEKNAIFKQDFIAGISHEMRTPMNGIMGMTEFLLDTNLNELQLDYAHTIKDSAQSLLSIINNVLNLSKIEQGKSEQIIEKTDFNDLLYNTKNLFRAQATSKLLDFSITLAPDFPPYLLLDKQNFRQVLYNLISNAIKYTRHGSVNVYISLLEKNKDSIKGICKIVDTGVGIPESYAETVFQPFTRIEDSYTRTIEGTGLGLNIAQKLVTMLKGEIGFESMVNKGSTFWFTFCANLIPGHQLKPTDCVVNENLLKDFNLNVLMAEDKIVNQKVASLYFKSAGCSLTIANNGKELLDLFKPGLYDVIFMDIMMPVMDGIEAMRQLRSRYTELPPIIALSAYSMEDDSKRFIDLGMDGYIEKPINREKLIKTLIGCASKKI